MKTVILTLLIIILLISSCGKGFDGARITDSEYNALKVLAGIVHLFNESGSEIWPGYNLARRRFIFYIPEKWVLLFNHPDSIEGFESYPEDWPEIECPVRYHAGRYDDLNGQLVFNFPVDTFRTVAIGISQDILDTMHDPNIYLFGFIVHEAFHQFQYDAFGDIPWAREELYPIMDRQNTTLAYLEMRILMDALESAFNDDRRQTEEFLRQFTAVRDHRWDHADPFVPEFEHGLEIREGTAQYVQLKSIDLFRRLPIHPSNDLIASLQKDFKELPFHKYVLNDFERRMTDHTISPEDMPRNRIYPLGSVLGLLSDYLGIDWKKMAQEDCNDFTFLGLLEDYFHSGTDKYPILLVKAKQTYEYDRALSSAGRMTDKYIGGYQNDFNDFTSQKGYRVEINFDYRSISRSRSSTSKRWLIDNGRVTLCKHYNIYTLKNDDLRFQLKDSGLYEETDWKAKHKQLLFYTEEISHLALDDVDLPFANMENRQFQKIEMVGQNFEFGYSGKGGVSVSNNKITIILH